MSYNDNNPERSARRHRPAIWAIVVAIGLAVIAFLMFAPMGGEQETGDVEVLAPGTGTTTEGGAAGTAGTATTGTATTDTAPAGTATTGTTAPTSN